MTNTRRSVPAPLLRLTCRTRRTSLSTSTGNWHSWRRWLPGSLAISVLIVGVPALNGTSGAATPPNSFAQTDLVGRTSSFNATLTDPNMTNAWGIAASPGGPIWVSDNNSGQASVYGGGVKGGAVSLELTVAVPGGNPTGQVYNPTAALTKKQRAFPVGGMNGSPALFIVDSDSIGSRQSPGEIAAWNGTGNFVVEDSPTGGPGGKTPANAVFKGLAIATTASAGPELYAADVANARVDGFNRDFAPVSTATATASATATAFVDKAIPAGYAPFGIQELSGAIYITYGKQNAQKTNVVSGAGLGYVDVFNVNGGLIKHLIVGGPGSRLDAPWGLTLAPAGSAHSQATSWWGISGTVGSTPITRRRAPSSARWTISTVITSPSVVFGGWRRVARASVELDRWFSAAGPTARARGYWAPSPQRHRCPHSLVESRWGPQTGAVISGVRALVRTDRLSLPLAGAIHRRLRLGAR